MAVARSVSMLQAVNAIVSTPRCRTASIEVRVGGHGEISRSNHERVQPPAVIGSEERTRLPLWGVKKSVAGW
jgi:hypothetical protein